VAPQNPTLGVMLPSTPLHYLLMADLRFPVVATSGNFSDEPICIDEGEAVARLGNIADAFLVHNRPIVRQVDDSVVQVIEEDVQVLRNARGYAPIHIDLPGSVPPCLAVGAHMKNSIAVAVDTRAHLSQHVGDLDTPQARQAMNFVARSLGNIYEIKPELVVRDKHGDYASTRMAEETGLPGSKVQHHYAHVLAGMIDNNLEGPVLGVAWDGTGLGDDGTIWGGEFLTVNRIAYTRTAHLATFGLPGGDKAVAEPRRSALSVLFEIYGSLNHDRLPASLKETMTEQSTQVLSDMLDKRINCPQTSSAGRLFDAVSSLLNIRHISVFEGQAAMMLGFAAEMADPTDRVYSYALNDSEGRCVVDWKPIIEDIIQEIESDIPASDIAAVFHNTLAECIVAVAQKAGEKNVLLTGGCFQNRYLTRQAIRRLRRAGFEPYWHHRIPPNDGGIAIGQLAAVLRNQEGLK
jgi:hydrogenase maturation protein HypF